MNNKMMKIIKNITKMKLFQKIINLLKIKKNMNNSIIKYNINLQYYQVVKIKKNSDSHSKNLKAMKVYSTHNLYPQIYKMKYQMKKLFVFKNLKINQKIR